MRATARNVRAGTQPLTARRVQWPLLLKRWRVIAACLAFQYVHGIFTQLVYRLHEPQAAPLKDLGFMLLPVGG